MGAKESPAESIFNAALAKGTPEDRARYLDEACGGDTELRARIDRLLQAYPVVGSFLQSPPQGLSMGATLDPSDLPLREAPGTVIGPYKLLQQIGEGGMGVVFLAEQTHPVRRQVALKVIKAGMDTRQVVARFEAERQALAMMDHVNIARVLDAGATESGRPYFVMELVRGLPITRYCDDNHLTPRQRLELFVPVCQAIQHAHTKGIIHRDVKPSNVLVTLYDGKPVAKVIDFGVAKAIEQKLTERTLFTQFGMMVGTLEYMSPEQAEMSALGVDARSDIYSLGVLLYELLTGSTPLGHKRIREAAYAEILRMIKEEEPPKPSTRLSDSGEALASISAQRHTEPSKLSKLMRGELDWIVMKTLEKDRNRRYETANGFAADVQRYLNDETVQACPPSVGYRFRKFARRNRAAVLTAASVLVVLLAGIAGTTFGLIRAEQRRAEAEQARANEAAEKKKAEQAESDTLADYRASTDDAIEQLIGAKADLGPQEKAYLERTLKRWQAFAARQGTDERSQAIRAEGHHRVGMLWARLDQRDAARTDYVTARDLYKQLAAAFPAVPGHRHELARTHVNLGNLLMNFGQRDAARMEFDAARALQTTLVAALPDMPEYQQKLATTHNSLGTLLKDLGQREAARMEHQAARDLRKKLADAFPNVPDYQQELASTHDNLGSLLRELGERDAARTESDTARDLRKKLVAAFPAVPKYQEDLALSHNSRAFLLADLGQSDAARTELETARDLYKKLADTFPAVPRYQYLLGYGHNNLGALLGGAGQHDPAHAEFEKARAVRKKLADAFPAVPGYQYDLAMTHNNLGNVLSKSGERDAARTEYETARELQKKLADAFPAVPVYQHELARTHNNLGALLNELGERDAARTECEAARDLYKKLADAFPAVPEYKAFLGDSYADLGTLIRDEGQPADSLQWYDLAIGTLTPIYEQDPRAAEPRLFLRYSHAHRATAYGQLKRHAEEAKDWHKAIEIDPKYSNGHYNLGLAFYQQGKLEMAIAAYKEAIKLDPKDAPAYSAVALALIKLRDSKKWPEAVAAAEKAIELDPKSANAYNVLGLALKEQKKLDAAAAAYQKAIDLDPKHSHAHTNLGTTLAQQGKYDQAIACCRTAIAINPKNIGAYTTIGIALRRQKKLDEAIAEYRKAIAVDPKDGQVRNNLGNVLHDKGEIDEAIAEYRKAIELDPKDAAARSNLGGTLNSRAWVLATDAEPARRDPGRAVSLAKEAIELDSKAADRWNTLGAAHYRAGNWKEAIASLHKFRELRNNDQEWSNPFFLAMAHWQLGNKVEAVQWHDKAVVWMESKKANSDLMRRVRAEAAELLKIDKK